MPGQELLETFAKYGGLVGLLMGTVIFISVGTNYLLWKRLIAVTDKLDEIQEKRVNDSKEVGKELLAQAEDYNKALADTGSAVGSLKDALMLRGRKD